jgi:hypothetical protein
MYIHEAGFILTDSIIGLAIKMHRALGPDLLEAVCPSPLLGTPARRHLIP